MGISRSAVMRALWAGAGLAGLIVAGCAQGGASGDGRVETAVVGDQSGSAADAAPEAAGSSPSAAGYYLAAHQAEEQGDRAAAANFMAEALKQDPGNLELLNETFQLMLSEGRMDVAESLARRLVAALPQSPMPNLLLAVEDAHGGDWPAAEARMAKLPKAGLATVAAPLVRGWVLAGEGKTDDAIKALDQLASVRGFAVLRDFHAAFIEDLAGRDAAAEADYQKALGGETAPSFRVVEALANFYARHGRSADALALFEKYKASNPDTVRLEVTLKALKSGAVPAPHLKDAKSGLAEAMFDLGSALRQDTGGGVALEFMRLSYYLEPSLDITRVTLADMLDGERRDAEALALYRGVAEGSPLYFSARLRATEVLRDMGKLDEAVGELERLAAAWPDRTEPYATEGDLLRSADRFAEAAKAYDKAIARLGEPQHADWSLYYARGVALERSGEWARAEKDFLEALKLSPEQPSVLNYLGYSWVDRGEHLNKAREMIERAVKLRPNDGYIVDSLGWVLYREGHYHSAVSHLERAVELKPDDPVINDHLGDAYWRVGRVSEARFQWRRALTLKPEPDLTNQLGVKLEHGLKSSKTGEHDS